MKILAIELSSARGSLAWLSARDEVERDWPNDRKNSGPFFDHLKSITEQYGLPETIIVGLGPGSYAGGRIAISAAIGLQAAARGRLIGYPSICAIDEGATEYGVIGDARRQSFFLARVRARALEEGPDLLTEKELREKLAQLGNRVPIFTCETLPLFSEAVVRFPSALVLARLAADSARSFAQPPLEPLYLREPHITMPRSTVIR